MTALHVGARIAGREIAIPVDSVNSAIRIGQPVPVPMTGGCVAGLVALRSKVLTLIDCAWQMGGNGRAACVGDLAIVLAVAGHDYGLLVDEIDDVFDLSDKPIDSVQLLQGEWKSVANGVADYKGRTLVVIDPAILVSPDLRRVA